MYNPLATEYAKRDYLAWVSMIKSIVGERDNYHATYLITKATGANYTKQVLEQYHSALTQIDT